MKAATTVATPANRNEAALAAWAKRALAGAETAPDPAADRARCAVTLRRLVPRIGELASLKGVSAEFIEGLAGWFDPASPKASQGKPATKKES